MDESDAPEPAAPPEPTPARFKEGRTGSLQVPAEPVEVAPADAPLEVPQALLDTPAPAGDSSPTEPPPADD